MSFILQTSCFNQKDLLPQLNSLVLPLYSSSQKIVWQFFALNEKLKIDGVRQLQKEILQAHQNQATVFFVLNLNQAQAIVQNALLKILEEPPTGIDFIVLCQNPAFLLPTITSRCLFLSPNLNKKLPLGAVVIPNNLESFWQISAWQKFAPTALAALLVKNFDQHLKQLDPETDFTKNQIAYQLFQQFLLDLVVVLDQKKQASLSLTFGQLLRLIALVKQSLIYLESNVSPKNVFYFLTLNF